LQHFAFTKNTFTDCGAVVLPDGTDICLPGDRTSIKVELIQPIAMEEGSTMVRVGSALFGQRNYNH